MCSEPDFDLPDSFVDSMRKVAARGEAGGLTIMLAPMEQQLVQKIAEQSGFSANVVASSLLGQGLTTFRSRGIVY